MPKKSKGKGGQAQGGRSDMIIRPVGPGSSICLKRRVTGAIGMSTNGSGVFILTVNPTWIRANATEWPNLSARYVEYRVLSIRVHLVMLNVATLAVMATDRSGTGISPGTVASIWALQGAKVYNGDETSVTPASYEARAIDLEDQNYTSVSTNALTFGVSILVQGPNTTAVGSLLVEALVEFKGDM